MKNNVKKLVFLVIILLTHVFNLQAQSDTTKSVYICMLVNNQERNIPFWRDRCNVQEFYSKFGNPYRIQDVLTDADNSKISYYLNNSQEETAFFGQNLDPYLVQSIIDANGGVREIPDYFESFEINGASNFYVKIDNYIFRVGDDIRPAFTRFPNETNKIREYSNSATFLISAKNDIAIEYDKINFRITDISTLPD